VSDIDSNLKSEIIYNIINKQNISVKLCDELDPDENTSIDESNNIMSDIICFCGARTKVFKTVLAGRKTRTWILSNYYRHLVNHFQKSDKRKPNKKGNQQNTVVNYFTVVNKDLDKDIVNKDNIEHNINKKSIEFEPILPECISEQNVPSSFLKPDVSSKWKEPKYSRQERKKRALEHSLLNDGENQPLITNYYKTVDQINKYINENNIFNESLEDLKNNMPPWEEISVETFIKKTNTSTLLKSICNSALRNSNFASSNANRYDESLKKFCVFLYFVGGRLLYETLQSNLTNSLPSISSLNRFISTQKQNIVEGEYRFKELKEFLLERNLPLCVWVSEDGTRVMGKIQYDQVSNKVIGFVLPFENGMADVNAYLATSANTIGQYFQNNEKANYAYVIMAKPLHENAPTFCLSIFGTNNRFNHKDVIDRWNIMEKMAADFGIKILGYSSDGDTRLLKAMQINSYQQKSTQFYIQDTVHIGTKLRTRLLKPNIVLPIGNYTISVSHLKILLETFSKDKHLLTLSDLIPEDKMNFRSAEKICSPVVQEMLKHVPQSLGAICFLETMNNILSSFLDKSLTVEDRIYRIWRSVYFLRIWRYSILKNKEYSLKDNFITTNAYSCIELNALSLILLVKKFRDSTYCLRPYMFIPWHFSSQTCEELFRTTRSMTSTFSTVVNFTMKDILQRLTRIELLNMIQNDLHEDHQNILQSPNPSHSDDIPSQLNPSQSTYNFPRYKKHSRNFINNTKLQTTVTFETILCDKKIEDILAASLNDAKLSATNLGNFFK